MVKSSAKAIQGYKDFLETAELFLSVSFCQDQRIFRQHAASIYGFVRSFR